jgi:hypothetical protein
MLIAGVVQALSQNLVHRRSLLLAQQFGAARKHPFAEAETPWQVLPRSAA